MYISVAEIEGKIIALASERDASSEDPTPFNNEIRGHIVCAAELSRSAAARLHEQYLPKEDRVPAGS